MRASNDLDRIAREDLQRCKASDHNVASALPPRIGQGPILRSGEGWIPRRIDATFELHFGKRPVSVRSSTPCKGECGLRVSGDKAAGPERERGRTLTACVFFCVRILQCCETPKFNADNKECLFRDIGPSNYAHYSYSASITLDQGCH